MSRRRRIAYFSMEIALESEMPTYSGGLGVLAGDTVRAAADRGVPMVCVSLLHRKGYFEQHVDKDGNQTEGPVAWNVESRLIREEATASVLIEERPVQIAIWRYQVKGITGEVVPVYFLDTELSENSEFDRELTHYLYGRDDRYRLCQEVVLGMGGVRALRELGYHEIERFHMNEGHASLLTLELLESRLSSLGRKSPEAEDIDAVKERCVFTTHTPVPAGHDQFSLQLARQVLGNRTIFEMPNLACYDGVLNMTFLGFNLSHYINGVAERHGEVSRQMFANYNIDSITNGVHASTWVSEFHGEVFDKYIPDWREDNPSLRYALNIPNEELWHAHQSCKEKLFERVFGETDERLDLDVLTLGFARRMTPYKRPELLFQNIKRLKKIAAGCRGLQIIYAGKAHPRDWEGKELIRKIFQAKETLQPEVELVFLNGYNTELGKLLTSGVDVWLNTPQPPLEASGTSGMKAALNGVPSFSVLDGWWIEGCMEGLTGWGISGEDEAVSLYDKLEAAIAPIYYGTPEGFIEIMKHAIALNGSFFNTERMIQAYITRAYFT